MSKELKYMMAEAVKADLDRSPDLLVMGMLPMDAEATVTLRTTLRSQGAQLRVIHNRTSRHALDEARKPADDALNLNPDFSPSFIAQTIPIQNPAHLEHFLSAVFAL